MPPSDVACQLNPTGWCLAQRQTLEVGRISIHVIAPPVQAYASLYELFHKKKSVGINRKTKELHTCKVKKTKIREIVVPQSRAALVTCKTEGSVVFSHLPN